MSERLRQEIARAEQWAAANDVNEYPYDELYAAVEAVLAQAPLSDERLTLLLDALALDDEAELIQDALREHSSVAEHVAKAGVRHPDQRTRWQAAVLAGEISSEEVVREYLGDPEEYVRRRVLLAARDRFPALAEATAVAWLESPHAYSRQVALDTLTRLSDAAHRADSGKNEEDA